MTLIVGLDHVQLAIPPGAEAQSAADRFWVGLLGFTAVAKPPLLAARGGAWYSSGPVQVHVGVEDPFTPARKAHPALVVAGLNALAATLGSAGVEVRWSDEVPGTHRFHVDDPFGNRLELIAAATPPVL